MRALPILRGVLGWLALALGVFMLAGWIGSSLPRNADWQEADEGVEIFVETNGVHTALILPAQTATKDWYAHFPPSHISDAGQPYTHLSISWGEREVFLNTPEWSDLSPMTVLRIAGIGGEGMIHVYHYVRPAPGDWARPVTLSEAQYARLVAEIEGSLPPPGARRYPGYGGTDVFYETGGRYTPANTCNQWTSDMLAAAGVKVGRWTPLAGGVTKWFPDPVRLP